MNLVPMFMSVGRIDYLGRPIATKLKLVVRQVGLISILGLSSEYWSVQYGG